MYNKLLKELEKLVGSERHYEQKLPLVDLLDLIIKVKTIQSLDMSMKALEDIKDN